MIYILVFLLVSVQPAHAYLDPGSGSVLVSLLVAGAAAAFYFLKGFFYEKIQFIGKKQGSIHKDHYGVVFYCEGKQYWNVFLPILQEMSARGQQCTYFASDQADPGLTAQMPNVTAVHIGEGHQAQFVLNRLSADVVVMTTPGLDVLQLKRSKKVGHYCHIVHGLEDTSTYPPYGVDYYDSVLVNGRHQKEVIRTLESARKSPEKQIEIIGSTYLDVMQKQLEKQSASEQQGHTAKPVILLAPSWGEKGFLSKSGSLLITTLLQQDFSVILRPHPQSWNSEAELLKDLKQQYIDNPNLIWDNALSGLQAMQQSHIMISDFSGIIFDYMFLFEKPVIVTDFQIDPRKFDMNALPSKSSTLMGLIKEGKIGQTLQPDTYATVHDVVEKVLHDADYTQNIAELREMIWCHPGEAAKRGADFIVKLQKEQIRSKT